ncbi:MAG: MBL fold metallo-hydrolase [Acutalibacteraceae bacterium]|nr:MBL fold metallo-hydrolase [Acutalibacteraceae bacterium]
MAKFCPLFSGSKANCTYISGSKGAFLVDVGASCKSVLKALEDIDEDIERIKAILITHEHSDHIKGLKALSKKYSIPVMASAKTLETLQNIGAVSCDTELLAIDDSIETEFGTVNRFDTMHDCDGSSGYSIDLWEGMKISVCTDLGVVTQTVREHLTGSNLILIESNHDLRMLQSGPYPPELKLRIAGERGHLSNTSCASELSDLLKSGTTRFILGHLSENNNLPSLALRTSQAALLDAGAKKDTDYIMYCALKENREIVYL